jgi:glyoxylase-like metal-dependent hydrolase (beta-lactamase superfamily II)
MRPVLPGVTLIDLPQENVWLLQGGGVAALIDTGLYWSRRRLLAALEQALEPGTRLTSIYLTHGHCDHAGNAAFLRTRFAAKVYCPRIEVPYVSTRRLYGWPGLHRLMFLVGEAVFPVQRFEVDVALEDGDIIPSPIGPQRVVHSPGHTRGHASYFHEANGWLFSGDAILNVIPFVRKTALCLSPPVFTEDMVAAANSARRLAELGPSALLSGHGWPHTENTAEALQSFVRGLPEEQDSTAGRANRGSG